MNTPDARKKLIIAGVIFGLIVVVMIAFALFQRATNPSEPETPKETTYIDPYSGEEITDTDGKVGETYNNENSVVYFGFAKLRDYGMTQDQIEILQTYILQYSLKREALNEPGLKEVTVDFKTYKQTIDQNTSEKTVTFDMIANRDENQRYYVINRSPSISTMWTEIYSSDKQTILFNAELESFGDNH